MWDYSDPCNTVPTLFADVAVDSFFLVSYQTAPLHLLVRGACVPFPTDTGKLVPLQPARKLPLLVLRWESRCETASTNTHAPGKTPLGH